MRRYKEMQNVFSFLKDMVILTPTGTKCFHKLWESPGSEADGANSCLRPLNENLVKAVLLFCGGTRQSAVALADGGCLFGAKLPGFGNIIAHGVVVTRADVCNCAEVISFAILRP